MNRRTFLSAALAQVTLYACAAHTRTQAPLVTAVPDTTVAGAQVSAPEPLFPVDADGAGIARVGLVDADLVVYDCGALGRDIPGGAYDMRRFVDIPVPGLRLKGDATFTRCKFEGPVSWPNPIVGTRYLFNPVSASQGISGHLFEDCVIDGGGVQGTTYYPASSKAIAKPFPVSGNSAMSPFAPGMAYTVRRCLIEHFEHSLQAEQNAPGTSILVEQCYMRNFRLVQYTGDISHVDGIQVAGSGVHDFTFRFNNLDFYNSSADTHYQFANVGSGGIFGGFPQLRGATVARLENVDIHHNRFNGGQVGWVLKKAADRPDISTWLLSATNAVIHDNVFGLQHAEAHDDIGKASDGSSILWINNRWEKTGKLFNGVSVLAGQVIP